MKKLLLMVVICMTTLTAGAQEIFVGGGISMWRDTDIDEMSFSISPEIGYEYNEKWAFGGEFIFSHDHRILGIDDNVYITESMNSFAIAPYARFTYYRNKSLRLFLDMGFGISNWKAKHSSSETGFEIGVKPGLAFSLNDHFSLVAKVGFAGYRDEYLGSKNNGFGVDLEGNNLSFGIEYAF